jgi:hypothetical protein
MGVAFTLSLVPAVPDALLAVWFKLLGEGLLQHQSGLLELLALGGRYADLYRIQAAGYS